MSAARYATDAYTAVQPNASTLQALIAAERQASDREIANTYEIAARLLRRLRKLDSEPMDEAVAEFERKLLIK